MSRYFFLFGFISFFATSALAAQLSQKELQTALTKRSSIINSIENKILRNKGQLKVLQARLSDIEKNRATKTQLGTSTHAVLFRLMRRPKDMPTVSGLDLVRGEKIVSALQLRNVRSLNQIAGRNGAIAKLSNEIEQQQQALRQELKKRKKAQKELKTLLAQKKRKSPEQNKIFSSLVKETKNASTLVEAIIARETNKNYRRKKNKDKDVLFIQPGAGTLHTQFGEKNHFGIHTLGIHFAMLSGAQIIAPAAGLILFAGPFRNYGNTIILATPGGYHILLAGLTRSHVEAGDAVFAKEPLGLMSNRQENPLLYLELRHLDRPINPEPLFIKPTPGG